MLAILLVAVPASLMAYLGYASERTASVVATSLPCDAADLSTSSDCVDRSRAVLADAGVEGFADAVYGPIVPLALFFTACFVAVGWTVGAHPRVRGPWLVSLLALTGVWVASVGWALWHWDATRISTLIVD